MTPKKKGLSSGNCEAQATHPTRKERIMTTITHAMHDTIALNIRYGLARRSRYNATGLAEILDDLTADQARDLYSGKTDYTVGQLGRLAAHFGVNPVDLLDENLTVSTDGPPEQAATICADSQCDKYEQKHLHDPGDPAVHQIRLGHVDLFRADDDPRWTCHIADFHDGLQARELNQLIDDAQKAHAIMTDLNRPQH